MSPLSRKWNSRRSNRRGIIASATAIRPAGTVESLEWLLMPWSEQNPSAFITDVSPQSQAPPACDKNILKSWVEWSPFLKQFRQIDMHGEIPQVRHRYATTCGIQTNPHFAWLSYARTGKSVFFCNLKLLAKSFEQKRVQYLQNKAKKPKSIFKLNWHVKSFQIKKIIRKKRKNIAHESQLFFF